MAQESLARFVQISDLHFGDVGRGGELRHPFWLKRLWRWLPAMSGLAGHDHQALIQLAKTFRTLGGSDRPPVLLVTGDLTSLGGHRQFDLAEAFICGQMPPPRFEPGIGLGTGPWLGDAMGGRRAHPHHAVPGNHDHWPARYYLLGPARQRMRAWARHLPYHHPPDPPLRVRFLALNTDADVGYWGSDRLLARGHFVRQVRRLARRLKSQLLGGRPDPTEVRVLLAHHSLAYRAAPTPPPAGRLGRWWRACRRWPPPLETDPRSREALERLLVEFDIRVLLTGHTHAVDVRPHVCLRPDGGRPFRFLEACCGTSAQLAEAPVGWPGAGHRIAAHAFLVHDLVRDARGVVWRAETWERTLTGGFRRSPRNAAGAPYAADLVVGP